MLTRRNFASAIAMVGATWAMPAHAIQEKDTLPKPPSNLVLGQAQVEDLLLLMDADKNGKISKAEWMNFMSAEFDRLDVDHSGELDPHELLKSQVSVPRARPGVQGK
jgi:hypothetical protein